MRGPGSRLLAASQCLAGVGLIVWAAVFSGLAGWGIGFGDLRWNLSDVLPWLAPLALGPTIEARQGAAGRKRLARVTATCALAALATIVSSVVGRVEYPSDPAPLPWTLLVVLVPLVTATLFLGFVTLATPALAARTRGGRVLAWMPFVFGLAIGVYPEKLIAPDHLSQWFFVTVAMLVSLGIALVATGGLRLLARPPLHLHKGPESGQANP